MTVGPLIRAVLCIAAVVVGLVATAELKTSFKLHRLLTRSLWKVPVENPVQGPAVGAVKKGSPRLAAAAAHPLDPLTLEETAIARRVLIDGGHIEEGKNMVHGVSLQEPAKAAVVAWKKGNALPTREAYAHVWKEGKLHTFIVDVVNKAVVKDVVNEGTGMPLLSISDTELAASIPLTYPPFLEALKKRNFPVERAFCIPFSGGWYDEKIDEGRRLIRTSCFDSKYDNFYMQPIEGVTLYLDLDKKEVYRFIDQGPVPTGDGENTRYSAEETASAMDPPMKPISIEQPDGVNFKIVDNYQVSWAKWAFHVSPDPRAGLIISRVTFNDTVTGTVRDILYQGHLSEMFVPYQDPSPNWFFRTFMDVGEYWFGIMSMSLVPLNDCPRNAHFIDGVMTGPDGDPYVTPNMLCIFERYSGNTAWRHTEPFVEGAPREARPKVTLVVRQAATVGNYDYTIDWEFQTDGLIRVTVTMSGMVTVKSVVASTVKDVPNGAELHGAMVNDHTVAVNHDHIINFRLDLDVDGPTNSFAEAKLVTKRTPEGSSWRTSYWEVESTFAKTELTGQFNATSARPAEYLVVNRASTTRLGNPRAYKLVPHTAGVPMMSEDDFPQIRAAWTKNTFWVTPYSPSERWAGGNFPNQCHGEDTLATWTLEDRPIEDTDIVVWYNLVYHHHPVQEDFPVMPSTLGSFDIKPANFFEANPAMGVRSFTESQLPTCESPSPSLFSA